LEKLVVLQRRVIQADRRKYEDPDLSDRQIDGLLRYFGLDAYDKLIVFLGLINVRKQRTHTKILDLI
jgi:hypothetical protein